MSAFPESNFDRLEAGQPVWSPYYVIHKYLAGMIDQYQLARDDQALDMGLPEALANLYVITGRNRYLAAAQRFYHAAVLGPLVDGEDRLAGLQCNVTTPESPACGFGKRPASRPSTI